MCSLTYLPAGVGRSATLYAGIISKIEPLLDKHGLVQEGYHYADDWLPEWLRAARRCGNRFVGTAPGSITFKLGGDRVGMRLNKIYKENLDEAAILTELDNLFNRFASERTANETFGDFQLPDETCYGLVDKALFIVMSRQSGKTTSYIC